MSIEITTGASEETGLGGKHVDVTVMIDGESVSGHVTLSPDAINGGWKAAGDSPEHWVSSQVWRAIRDRADYSDVLDQLETSAREVVEA